MAHNLSQQRRHGPPPASIFLREWLAEEKVTEDGLARRCGWGRAELASYLDGDALPPIDELAVIADVLYCEPFELFIAPHHAKALRNAVEGAPLFVGRQETPMPLDRAIRHGIAVDGVRMAWRQHLRFFWISGGLFTAAIVGLVLLGQRPDWLAYFFSTIAFFAAWASWHGGTEILEFRRENSLWFLNRPSRSTK